MNVQEHEIDELLRMLQPKMIGLFANIKAELAKPEGCLSNCDTCTYAWSSPANPGHCFMFYEEPQGVCPKHSEPHQTRNCSRHPDAPHGPDGAGCKCHSWAPGEAS